MVLCEEVIAKLSEKKKKSLIFTRSYHWLWISANLISSVGAALIHLLVLLSDTKSACKLLEALIFKMQSLKKKKEKAFEQNRMIFST